jgi:DNA-binding transcriptional LysR family regulator
MQRETSVLSTAYRYFLAVAHAGSVRGAAKALNIVPSAVNRQILMLERDVGVDLFERVGRGLRLSEAGTLLLRELDAMLERFDETAADLAAFRGLKRGRVRIATVESVSVNLLPDMLAGFLAAYPGMEVSVTVTGSEAVTRLASAGDVDVGFTFNPISTDQLRILYERGYRIGALMVPGHPLAGRASVPMEAVIGHRFALPARGLSLRAALEPALARLPHRPRPRLEADTLRLMAALARREGLVAFQTEVGIERELAAGTLVLVPLSDPDIPVDRLVVVMGTSRTPSLAVAAFQDFALAHLSGKPA